MDIVQELKNEQLSYELQKGQSVSALWHPADPSQALITYNDAPPEERGKRMARGSHCSITPYDHEGKVRFPEHEPYWKNYRWESSRNPQDLVRWHGYGNLRWTPLLYGEEAAEQTYNAVFKNNTIGVKGNNTFAEVWYRIKLPYLISHISADWSVKGPGAAGLGISADNGYTLWNLKRGGTPIVGLFSNGQADYIAGKPSVQGLREFLLRVDLLAYDRAEDLRVDALRLQVFFHHNMQIQPRLLPGENTLFLEAEELGQGETLEARWNATVAGEEQTESLTLEKAGNTEKAASFECKKPEDIVMRGITLEVR
jgi:hypothetical protein